MTGSGRDQRLSLTSVGARRLAAASHAVATLEERMLAGLSAEGQDALRKSLETCVRALTASDP